MLRIGNKLPTRTDLRVHGSAMLISSRAGGWEDRLVRIGYSRQRSGLAPKRIATLAGSGAANEAGAVWMIVLDISVIAAMQAGYIGGSALFVAVAD